jgi:hypothetical protein
MNHSYRKGLITFLIGFLLLSGSKYASFSILGLSAEFWSGFTLALAVVALVVAIVSFAKALSGKRAS